MSVLASANIPVPQRMSIATVGCGDDFPCSGYYVSMRQKAAAVAEILRGGQNAGPPTTLWLSGILVDRGTTTHVGLGQEMIDELLRGATRSNAVALQ